MRVFALGLALLGTPAWANDCFEGVLRGAPKKDGTDLSNYEAYRVLGLKPTRSWSHYHARTGWDRRGDNTPPRLRVLVDNPHADVRIVGDFNGWNRDQAPKLRPVAGTPYAEVEVPAMKHGMEYRLLVDGQERLDPAAPLFTTPEYVKKVSGRDSNYLNSVYWDYDAPERLRPRVPGVDLRDKPAIIAEAELFELARQWKGGPPSKAETYQFIVKSGLPEKMKDMGYNAVEFLPFNASVDGESWHLRYQVFGPFAPESRYGTPDDMIEMVDAFHRQGVAVIMDGVVGHFPFFGNEGVREIGNVGLHTWKRADGAPLYSAKVTEWQTHRYNFANPYVRRFLTDSLLTMMKRFNLDGIRFDNLDGIRFLTGGTELLDDFAREVRAYRPDAYLLGEMFFGDDRVLRSQALGGMGMNTRTDSDFFDFFKDNALSPPQEIDMNRARHALRKPWEWKEASRTRYVTNHDEAANGREGATGRYFATLTGGDARTAGKTRAFSALAMTSGSSYLDLPQLRLLQEGNFYANPAVEWARETGSAAAQNTSRFFADLAKYVQSNPAFALKNLHPDVENHVDHATKIVSMLRIDHATGKKTYIVANLGDGSFENYRFGVEAKDQLKVVVDADAKKYGGSGKLETSQSRGILTTNATAAHGKSRSVEIPYVAPYDVIVLKE